MTAPYTAKLNPAVLAATHDRIAERRRLYERIFVLEEENAKLRQQIDELTNG